MGVGGKGGSSESRGAIAPVRKAWHALRIPKERETTGKARGTILPIVHGTIVCAGRGVESSGRMRWMGRGKDRQGELDDIGLGGTHSFVNWSCVVLAEVMTSYGTPPSDSDTVAMKVR